MSHVDNKRIAKNTLLLYGRMGITIFISLYTSRIILSALGFVDFGVYNVVGGIVVVFSSLTGALSGSTSRFITLELGKGDKGNPSHIFSTATYLHIVLALLIILLSETIGLWFLNHELDIPENRIYAANWLLQFSILTAAISFTQVPYTAAMIAHEHMSIFAYVGIYSSLANLGVAFLIAHEPFDRLIWYGLLVLLVNISSLVISRVYCIKHFDECKLRAARDRALYKQMLSYTGYSLWVNLAWMAQNQGVSFILNIFFGPILNAAQAISHRIYSMLEQLYGAFGTAIKPTIYRLYAQGEYVPMNKLAERGASMSYMLVLLAVIPFSVNIDFILKIWLGEYPDYTPIICILVMAAELFAVISNTRLMLFQASNHIKEYSLWNGSILLLGLPIIYVLFKMGFSPYYAFAVLLSSAIASDFMSLYLIGKFIPEFSRRKFFCSVHLRCIATTVVIVGIILVENLFVKVDWCRFITSTLTSSALIASFLWFCVMSRGQREKVMKKLNFLKIKA